MTLRDTIRIFNGYPGQLSRILGFVSSIDATLGAIQSALRTPKPGPFVLVLIQAVKVERKTERVIKVADPGIGPDDPDYGFGRIEPAGPFIITDKPITLAFSHEAPHTFNCQPDRPIAKLQIAVITDIRLVRIEAIVVANHHICPSIEGGPLSYHDGIVEVANRITIVTSLR